MALGLASLEWRRFCDWTSKTLPANWAPMRQWTHNERLSDDVKTWKTGTGTGSVNKSVESDGPHRSPRKSRSARLCSSFRVAQNANDAPTSQPPVLSACSSPTLFLFLCARWIFHLFPRWSHRYDSQLSELNYLTGILRCNIFWLLYDESSSRQVRRVTKVAHCCQFHFFKFIFRTFKINRVS